jgi:putative ABC transport system permease protein
MITLTGQQEITFKVTGVIEDIPVNSHFQFDMLLSLNSVRLLDNADQLISSWDNDGFYSYLLLDEGADLDKVNYEMMQISKANVDPKLINRHDPFLFPLEKIHLYSNLRNEMGVNGNIQQVYIFIVIAIFIILIASFNYINLSTAVAARRSMEVGVRKVFGAIRFQLIRQFLTESLILVVISGLLGIFLVELIQPYFKQISGSITEGDVVENTGIWVALSGIILFTGILSGAYPAFVLSSFKPKVVLKGQLQSGLNISERFRKILVVFQFSISVILLIASASIVSQINYLYNKSLGYNPDNLLVIRNSNNAVTPKIEVFKKELNDYPHITSVGASFSVPGGLRPIVGIRSENTAYDEDMNLAGIFTDLDYLKTLQVHILKGRDFDPLMGTDTAKAIILNKKAVEDLNLGDYPIGKTLIIDFNNEEKKRKVIGVIDDINFEPLYRPTEGAFFMPGVPFLNFIFVRLDGKDTEGAIQYIENKWHQFAQKEPFEYSFLGSDLTLLYEREERLKTVVIFFSILAIFIAMIGLYGLSSFSILQRTREIGIRKVLGATVSDLLKLFSKKYIFLLLITNALAWPLAWLLVSSYLDNFVYHVPVNGYYFIFSLLIVSLLALVTISVRVVQVSSINPSVTLKYE